MLGTEANQIYLRSATPGSTWNIDPQGTRNVAWVNVTDSSNINSTAIDATNSTYTRSTGWGASSSSDTNTTTTTNSPSLTSQESSMYRKDLTGVTMFGSMQASIFIM